MYLKKLLLSIPILLFSFAAVNAQSDDPPVDQEYDWYLEHEIPAETEWGTPINREATEQIRKWTTRPEFIAPIVDYLPNVDGIPSPYDHFGQSIGQPGTLHYVDELYEYYQLLAESSSRMNYEVLGESEEGNEMVVLQISSEENLARLEEVKAGMNALADPRTINEQEAQQLIQDLPIIYTVYTGLHSAETAHPEMAVELAYRLAAAEHPQIKETLENVVVFLVPVVETDGRNRMLDWYHKHGEDIYDDAEGIPRSPYWGSYAGHDNNRNAIQLYLRLTEEMLDLFLEWKHPISLDVHEAGDATSYHYFSTGTGPYNEYIDPITIKEWQWMANYESTSLERHGMPGVFTHDFYDGWFPGYLFWITNNRNAIGRFTETWAGFSGLPYTRVREPSAHNITREWFRPNPAYPKANWSFRNVINYMQSGQLNSLYWASVNRQEVLENFWIKSKNSLEKGMNEAPYAWVVPADQDRNADAAYVVNLLRKHGIEVNRAESSGSFGEHSISEGDYVVNMAQPYRNFAHMLMDVQIYPSEGEEVAYIRGGMAWTLPMMFNIEAFEVDDADVQSLNMTLLESDVLPFGELHTQRRADYYAVHPKASAKSLQARYVLEDVPVQLAHGEISVDRNTTLAPGSWLISVDAMSEDEIEEWANKFGYRVYSVRDRDLSDLERSDLALPRLGVLQTWRETRDEGHVRFSLDYLEIPYELVTETSIADRDLRSEFDVILFPEQGRNSTGKAIFEGVDTRHGALSYEYSEEYPTLGYPASAPDITGGMGYGGLESLKAFVEQGGTFITLGSATRLPIEFSLTQAATTWEPQDLIIPGSIVKGVVPEDHIITYGYDSEIPLWHKFGPYLDANPNRESSVPVRYANENEIFMSGSVVEPAELEDKPALISHKMGEGNMVLFGFNPIHRYQPHGNFALVWNSIMYWDQLN